MIVAVGFVQILGCGRADTYRPVYYPDGGNLSAYTRGPAFENLAQARQWVEDQNRQRQDPNSEPRTYAYNYRDSVAAGVASSTSLSSVSG